MKKNQRYYDIENAISALVKNSELNSRDINDAINDVKSKLFSAINCYPYFDYSTNIYPESSYDRGIFDNNLDEAKYYLESEFKIVERKLIEKEKMEKAASEKIPTKDNIYSSTKPKQGNDVIGDISSILSNSILNINGFLNGKKN